MQVFGISDVGQKRQLNEDNFSVWQKDNMLVAVVADGMGGAQAGEIASRLACRRFMDILTSQIVRISNTLSDSTELILSVDRAIAAACQDSNVEVFSRSNSDNSLSGMGTTLAGCVIIDNILWAFHIGDSRVYHIDKNDISQLTVDHSLVQSLIDAGKITPEQAQNHPNKNIILRAVGVEKNVECDISHMTPRAGYYLICSDGLSNYFDKRKFSKIINADIPLSEKAEALVDFANASGGADNITAVLIDTEIKLEDVK